MVSFGFWSLANKCNCFVPPQIIRNGWCFSSGRDFQPDQRINSHGTVSADKLFGPQHQAQKPMLILIGNWLKTYLLSPTATNIIAWRASPGWRVHNLPTLKASHKIFGAGCSPSASDVLTCHLPGDTRQAIMFVIFDDKKSLVSFQTASYYLSSKELTLCLQIIANSNHLF